MNTDRFLTRVFDKYLKSMTYSTLYAGLNENGIFYFDSCFVPFGDRFVPMMCTGLKDKNGKLIYDDDLIKFENDLYLCVFNGFAFGLSSIKEACNVLVPTTLTRNKSEIIGNKWENPELLEGENDE